MLHHFDVAYDVYSEIRWRIQDQIEERLFPSKLERFQAKCPACVFRVDDEEPQEASMLVCMDGNESLKQVERRFERERGSFEVVEYRDERKRPSVMFIESEKVDRFKDEVAQSQSVSNSPSVQYHFTTSH